MVGIAKCMSLHLLLLAEVENKGIGMDNERSAKINIGGQEYELILTTKATKEIAGRYGGLENLGEKLLKSENFEMALDEIVWLITLMANQSLLIHNLRNPDNKNRCLLKKKLNFSHLLWN